MKSYTRRKLKSHFMQILLLVFAILAVSPLLAIFIYVLKMGLPALNWEFFFDTPKPVGESGGGMAHALVGSGTLILLASFLGIPWGLGIGTYLSEYGRGKLATAVRFTVDMMTSTPSIVVGIFAYALVVVPFHGFSAYAGAFALSVIMVPNVAKSTEEILKLVPGHIREAGLALGIARWKVVVFIVLNGSKRALLTGTMLAIARAAGETAPLLFTAFSNRNFARGLNQPTASLPVQIYTYAVSPYDEWHAQAWAGALVLVLFVLCINVLTRVFFARRGEA